MSTKLTTIANRPANKPVFDFTTAAGIARVVFTPVSNDGANLVVSGWAYLIDANGTPVLDPTTAAPIATPDGTRTVALSGVMAGTRSLYDGWVIFAPDTQTTINAATLPEGWESVQSKPIDVPTAGYGAKAYDTVADKPYVYEQGCLEQAAQSLADALEAQIDIAAKLANLGL